MTVPALCANLNITCVIKHLLTALMPRAELLISHQDFWPGINKDPVSPLDLMARNTTMHCMRSQDETAVITRQL